MSAIGISLFSHLSGHAGLAALVDSRVYPIVAPQDPERPYLTYQLISRESEPTHDGPSGLDNPRLQIDTWASTYVEAGQVAKQVRAAMDGFVGTVGDVEFQASFLDEERDLYEDATQPPLYRVSQDYRGWVREAA